METIQTKFRFKGSRHYIHGTDMFNTLLATYAGDKTDVSHIRFSVHGFVYKPVCLLYSTDSKEALNSLTDVRARCQFEKHGKTQWLALVETESDNAIDERYEYNEDLIVSLCHLDKDRLILTQKSPFTFIETVVAMNKHLHQQLFPEVDGKWIFTRIDLAANCDACENVTLQFMHNMNYRLTKTDVLVNGKKQGDIFFSLVKS